MKLQTLCLDASEASAGPLAAFSPLGRFDILGAIQGAAEAHQERFAVLDAPELTEHEDLAPANAGPAAALPAPSAGARAAPDDATVCGHIAAMAQRDVGRVYGLALRITRQAAAAEEVAEDVYLQAWRTASSYTAARGRPLTWLLTICRSRALDY